MAATKSKSLMKKVLFGLGLFIIANVILNIAYSSIINMSINEEKTRYKYIAINEANYISSCIDKVIVRTYTIREMINQTEGNTIFFDKIGENIIQTVKADAGISLRNIAVAPNGIVEKVTPFSSNEALIGFNFMDETKVGNKEAIESYKQEHTIITNPFSLVQGGVGMAGRTPVFITKNGSREFWGLVTATMDFSDVLSAFNFANFDKMHVKYRLWYSDEEGKRVVLDESFGGLENADVVTEDVKAFNLLWHLDVVPEKGWFDKNIKNLSHVVIFVISVLFATLVLLMFRIKHDGIMMKNLAEQDSLTGCYSRHYLNSEIIDIQTGNWKSKNNNYSVAIVDVDKFKQINDTYGHVVGDRALISIAKVLRDSIVNPKKDRIVRFGGDEFLIFYDNLERKDLRIKFQDLLSSIESIKFDDIPELKLGVSVGVGIPEFANSHDYKDLMKRADDNLYQVKENGRNNYIMA